MLTLAHHPHPPAVIGLEEPDRGVHPRLLREIQDAILRLSDPKSFGDQRPAVQVIVTTHSPYFIDLFGDQPESVVIASKQGLSARFERLSDQPHFEEVIRDSQLGEAWYTGVLGGVPAGS